MNVRSRESLWLYLINFTIKIEQMHEKNCKEMINVGWRVLSYLERHKVVPEEFHANFYLKCYLLFYIFFLSFKIIWVLNNIFGARLELCFIDLNPPNMAFIIKDCYIIYYAASVYLEDKNLYTSIYLWLKPI